jgi:hypothetical protein
VLFYKNNNPNFSIDLAAVLKHEFPKDLVYSAHKPEQDYCHSNEEIDDTNVHKQPTGVRRYMTIGVVKANTLLRL